MKKRVFVVVAALICFTLLFGMVAGCANNAGGDGPAVAESAGVTGEDGETSDAAAADAAELPENMEISYVSLERIDTTETQTLYTGLTSEVGEKAVPADGSVYVLVSAAATGDEKMPLDGAELLAGGNAYQQVEDYGHLLSLLGKNSIDSEEQSDVALIFEVVQDDAEDDADMFLVVGGEKYSLQDKNLVKISSDSLMVKRQWAAEAEILNAFKAGDYTLDDPYVAQNPYEVAPLTALVLFDTEKPAAITVRVEGKKDATSVENTIEEYTTFHEVPVIGLYAGTGNKVTLTAEYEDGTSDASEVTITTEALPDELKDTVDVVQGAQGADDDMFVYCIDRRRVVFDKDGDIRWYTTMDATQSGVVEFLDNGHFLLSTEAYENTACIYELDFMGKIYWVHNSWEKAHHDATETPDGNIAFLANDSRISVVDKETSADVRNIPLSAFDDKENLELRHQADEVMHTNTISFLDDENILLSLRNQHMVLKMDFETEDIQWILSPSIEYYPELADKFLTPVDEDMEWFYSQHEPVLMPDQDGDPATLDILLFDNGDERGLPGDTPLPLEDRYSRIVHYRINENDMTVEQIFEYGKELGFEGYAYHHSGAQFIEDTGTYLGTFDVTSTSSKIDEAEKHPSVITEVDSTGEVLFRANMNETIYRSYEKDKADLYAGVTPLLTERAVVAVQEATPAATNKKYEETPVEYNLSQISETGGYVQVKGWAYPSEKDPGNYKTYMYMQNMDDPSVTYRFSLYRYPTISYADQFDETVEGVSYAGFINNYVNLAGVQPGRYQFAVVFDIEDALYGEQLPYYVEVGKQDVDVYSVLNKQAQIEERLALARKGTTLEEAQVTLNPYGIAPLTALIDFDTEVPSNVSVTIEGKDDLTTIEHTFEAYETEHSVPIYGLYPGTVNKVDVVVTDESGNETSKQLEIETAPLPEGFVKVNVLEKADDYDNELINFMSSAASGLIAYDANGDIRWYSTVMDSLAYLSPVKQLKNGNLAVMGGEMVSPYYMSHVFELDLIGKIVTEYEIPRNSGHHEVMELDNGNLMVLSGNSTVGVAEDSIVEFDRETGEVINSVNLMDVVPLTEYVTSSIYYPGNMQTAAQNLETEGITEPTDEELWEECKKISGHDWIHVNSFYFDEDTHDITLSARHLNSVIKFNYDTLELKWILGDPENSGYKDNEAIQEYLLTPEEDDFKYTYGQHSVNYTSDGDLLVFDNRFNDNAEKLTEDESDAYTRLVRFDIDEGNMTVKTVWEWGEQRGNELFSNYVSNIQILDSDDHLQACFGGIVYDKETGIRTRNTGTIFAGTGAGTVHVVELEGDDVVFEIETEAEGYNNAYRCYKYDMYSGK